MPSFYCEYCETYLKHSSPFGRKQHNRGKKHIQKRIEYFSAFIIEEAERMKMQMQNNLFRQNQVLGQNNQFYPPGNP